MFFNRKAQCKYRPVAQPTLNAGWLPCHRPTGRGLLPVCRRLLGPSATQCGTYGTPPPWLVWKGILAKQKVTNNESIYLTGKDRGEVSLGQV